MSSACIVLVIVAGVVILAGVRVRGIVPKHWATVRGEWLGPSSRWSPHRYQYRAPDGTERVGVAKVKVMWRPQYGGDCVVAYDPADPSRSQPAQLRWNGTVLIVTGIVAAVSGVVLLVVALS